MRKKSSYWEIFLLVNNFSKKAIINTDIFSRAVGGVFFVIANKGAEKDPKIQ
jgi:hypothetical protein